MHLPGFHQWQVLSTVMVLLALISRTLGVGEVIWAVNCGGDAHTDIHGIRYQRDTLQEGIESDYGKNLMIHRVVPQDQILYQTERYHTSTFGYEFPIKQDGDYVLVLKFSEVWFTAPNKKVFDVILNGEHVVVQNLDIFEQVGRGVGHDELVPFTYKGGKIKVSGETSALKGNKVSVQFVKGDLDNPKINAMYVMKGSMDDVPKLPQIPGMPDRNQKASPDGAAAATPHDEEEEEDEAEEGTSGADGIKRPRKPRRPSGPRVQDPYAADDTGSMLLPMFIAIGAFIPLLFCLCKL